MNDHTNYSHTPYFNSNEVQQGRIADKKTLVISRIKTPVGDLLAGASNNGICLLEFTDTNRIERQLARLKKHHQSTVIAGENEHFLLLHQQLQDYFTGKLNVFDIPLDLHGTPFQQQAWEALQIIPYGETRSYQQQAIAIHNPKAVRAVANANRNNKISIIIPCHRVIGKNGSMTGYGGGIWRKEYLLELEAKYSK